jgi:pimeloyl-ACP methyl ester carboxylesterase
MPERDGVKRIQLRDGRGLAFAEWGDPGGQPIFLFHGAYGSRFERPPDDELTAFGGVRLLTVDRPGHGASDFQPRRQISDWADDVGELADALGLDSFALLGWSQGGAYALACAHALADRVTRVLVAGSVAPLDRAPVPREWRVFVRLFRAAPWLMGARLSVMRRRLERDAEAFVDRAHLGAAACDREIAARPDIRGMFASSFLEGLRPGVQGVARSGLLNLRPWDFDPAEIEAEVHVWHGDADRSTPISFASWLERTLPRANVRIFPGEGHYVALTHWPEVLDQLVG